MAATTGPTAPRGAAVRGSWPVARSVRLAAAGYLVLQGVAVLLWWAALLSSPGFRAVFELGDPAVLDAFLPADVVLGVASTGAGLLAARGHRSARVLTGAALGAVLYSTAMTCSFVLSSGSGAVGVGAMLAASAGTAVALLVLRGDGAAATAGGTP